MTQHKTRQGTRRRVRNISQLGKIKIKVLIVFFLLPHTSPLVVLHLSYSIFLGTIAILPQVFIQHGLH